MAIDGGLRPLFRQRLPGHWQSVETGGTGLGIPDSSFCIKGAEGWIEFKTTETTKVPLRTEQIGWLTTRHFHGGRVFVGVRFQHDGGPRKGEPADELWLLHGGFARDIAVRGLTLTEPYVLGRWVGGPGRWAWDAVAELLQSR